MKPLGPESIPRKVLQTVPIDQGSSGSKRSDKEPKDEVTEDSKVMLMK